MASHFLDSYKDGFKTIMFCRVCGVEEPVGECAGYFVGTKLVNEKETKKDDKSELTR